MPLLRMRPWPGDGPEAVFKHIQDMTLWGQNISESGICVIKHDSTLSIHTQTDNSSEYRIEDSNEDK